MVTQVKLVTQMTVEYKLLAESSQFSIDGEGVIKLTSALDREAATSHTLGVLALRPPLSGFTEVYVSVVDVNDNPPRFQSAVYNVRVAENVAEGTSIIRGKQLRILTISYKCVKDTYVFNSSKTIRLIKFMNQMKLH